MLFQTGIFFSVKHKRSYLVECSSCSFPCNESTGKNMITVYMMHYIQGNPKPCHKQIENKVFTKNLP